MQKFIITKFFLLIVFLNNLSAEEIKIFEPSQNQQFCRNEQLIFKWTGINSDYIIEAKSELSGGYKKIQGYEINGNSLQWYVNDKDFLNVPFSVIISEKSNPLNFDEIQGLTVFEETQILDQTKSVQTCNGDDVYLKVDALGYGLSYLWLKDGEKIEGENNNILIIKNAEFKNSGSYQCRITSAGNCETILSKPISVYIATPTKFTSSPEEVFWEYNKSAVMTAGIHANSEYELKNVKFNWYKDTIIFLKVQNGFIPDTIWKELNDGKKYTGTKSQELAVKNLVWSDQTAYYCIADGLCGSDTVSSKIGSESRFEVIKASPDYYDCEGQDVTFKAKVITEVQGTFTYQWYKTGFKKLPESDKYIGTQTLQLTIKNANHKVDLNNYYVLATWVEKKVSKRSEHFIYDPKFKPEILTQPVKIFILNDPPWAEYPTYGGQTHIYLTVDNITDCKFEWIKKDSLGKDTIVRSEIKKFESNYNLGGPASSGGQPIPRPAQMSDTGEYRCRVTNECGETWSDTAWIVAPNKKIIVCDGSDIELKVFDMKRTGGDYIYKWSCSDYKNEIKEDEKHSGVNTNILSIKNAKRTNFDWFDPKVTFRTRATNKKTGLSYNLGYTEVYIKTKPNILKQLPQLMKSHSSFLPEQTINVMTYGPQLFYRFYKDGVPWGMESVLTLDDTLRINCAIEVFGSKMEMETGIYYIKFWNDCGEINSRQFEIEIVGGIVKGDETDEEDFIDYDEITGVNPNSETTENFHIYPNPADDYITIQSSEGLQPSEDCEVQIFDMLGIEVKSEIIHPMTASHWMNIHSLPVGIYFIRMGDKFEKFVKM